MTGKQNVLADRLCSEIQLFDLCDLDSCGHKKQRFCTNEELLHKFEAIREEDERNTLIYDENEAADEDGCEDDADFDDAAEDYEEDDR